MAEGAPVLRIALDGLSYDGTPVLGEIALDVLEGQTVALVGPSGIGKSTLLRAIAGLQSGYRGRIDAPDRIGMIFQEPTLLPWRTLSQNIEVTAKVGAAEAAAALASVGLGGRGRDYPGQLSLGQQRRLSLARAFAVRPELLLMDEPFVSLDPELVEEMMRLFVRLRDEARTTTLLVTHVEAEAQRLADRIVTLGGQPARITGEQPAR